MSHIKEYVVATYLDEEPLFSAVQSLQREGVKIDEVYTPYPVHGLDKLLNMRDTKLHTAGFIYGALGLTIALSFISWVMLVDWPINYGGKPLWALPAFIPILFEFTVLSAAVGMVLTFFYLCRLAPGAKKHHFHQKATDDTFTIAIKVVNNRKFSVKQLETMMKKLDPQTVEIQNANSEWWFGSYASTTKVN